MTDQYYNQEKNTDWEGPAFTEAKYAITSAEQSGLISHDFLSTIINDPEKIGFYTNAIAYGGYTIGDIINDMKRSELVSQGNTQAKGIKLIDPEITKGAYMTTSEGQRSYREASSVIPTYNLAGSVDPEILKYGANIPDELFKTLVPLLDKDSEEFKTAVDNIKSAFYDIANQQLQATSEQEKAIADYNYNKFKEQINEQYGIALSDDAIKAWNQIENLETSFSERGLSGSGLENEAIFNTLSEIRKQDQQLRKEKLTQEEAQMASHYSTSATPEQIQSLIDEDKAKGLSRDEWRATKWGLVPSQDILDKFSMENLKERYPDQSEKELQAYRDTVLDENGNYRSSIYSKYYSGLAENTASKKALAETTVLQDAMNKEESAYRNYDTNQSFSQATKSDIAQMESDTANKTEIPTQVPSAKTEVPDDVYKKAQDAISKAQNVIQQTQSYINPNQQNFDAASKAASNINKTVQNTTTAPTNINTTQQTTSTPKSYTTLYDYYTKEKGTYNAWNSSQRIADVQKAGINNYEGTAEQNKQLLDYLNKN